MRRHFLLLNSAALYEFIDGSFLNSKRPAVPGGAWPLDSLRQKSLADLQQIWLTLLRERNQLTSTREHYLRHQEELGAMPAPSRLEMIETSMQNVRQVVKERDAEATEKATAIFKERMRKGVYRYPPGPPPPPGAHDRTSTVKLTLSARVDPERLRELLGRYDVFESHRGIVKVELVLPEAVQQQKKDAEQLWQQYRTECRDVAEYHKWELHGQPSRYDYAEVELAPGVFATDGDLGEQSGAGESLTSSPPSQGAESGEGVVVVAATLPVPAPLGPPRPPQNPLERIKLERKSALNKAVIQLGYFPNITLEAPRYRRVEDVPRPTHPDEILGPWECYITYDAPDGLEYVQSILSDVPAIDGASVVAVERHVPAEPQPYAAVDPVYQEAVRRELASEETQMQWPHVPTWKGEYDLYTKKHVGEIVQHNYTNVVDYVDREVLLTGRSVWEMPIKIDPTCGGQRSVPAHAKRPSKFLPPDLTGVGVTDI